MRVSRVKVRGIELGLGSNGLIFFQLTKSTNIFEAFAVAKVLFRIEGVEFALGLRFAEGLGFGFGFGFERGFEVDQVDSCSGKGCWFSINIESLLLNN